MARYQFSDHAELRAISHIDMDCFYVQVEQRRNPDLIGKPTAVVQYNPWKGGGLIAVGYEARARGVKKQMRGDDAREHCPDINLVTVPTAHGKADLTIYREAGAEVVSILSRKGRCERASIDEVYLDLTEAAKERMAHVPASRDDLHVEAQKSHILGVTSETGCDAASWLVSRTDYSERLLAAAALIVAELREAVRTEARFSCSAGIAHNKMLAKLASNMHKPAQQTLVPLAAVPALYEELPLKKLRQLGGKLGVSLEEQLGVRTAGDLMRVPLERLQDMHGKNVGMWLFRMSRGLDDDPVRDRVLPKSHGCSKTFPGRNALPDLPAVRHWVRQLALELDQRLEMDCEQNGRFARLLVAHVSYHTEPTLASPHGASKSGPIAYGAERIAVDAFGLVKRMLSDCKAFWVTEMGLSATNLQATPEKTASITSFFVAPVKRSSTDSEVGERSESRGVREWVDGDESGHGPIEDIAYEEQRRDGTSVAKASSGAGQVTAAEPSTGAGTRREMEGGRQKVKRQRSPLRDWLAAADSQRTASGLHSDSQVEEKAGLVEIKRSTVAPAEWGAHEFERRTASGIGGCGGTEAEVATPQIVGAGLQKTVWECSGDGTSELKTDRGAERGEDCEDVQLTLEEWIPDRAGSDSRPAAADLESGAQERAQDKSIEEGTGAAVSAEAAGPIGEGVPELLTSREEGRTTLSALELPRNRSSQELVSINSSLERERWNGTGTRDEQAPAQQVRNRVEALKSLEALWQKAALPQQNQKGDTVTSNQVANSKEETVGMQPLIKKRASEGRVSDAREKMQKMWSGAAVGKGEHGPAELNNAASYDFNWQEVDQSTLDELPLAIQAEIRAAQRLHVQRQQPKPARKLDKPHHAQSIKPFFQRKSR